MLPGDFPDPRLVPGFLPDKTFSSRCLERLATLSKSLFGGGIGTGQLKTLCKRLIRFTEIGLCAMIKDIALG